MKRKIILMVGLPATGKSTYVKKKLGGVEKNSILSSDSVSEEVARSMSMYYSDGFVVPNEDEIVGRIAEKGGQYGIVVEVEKLERLDEDGNVIEHEEPTYRAYSVVEEMKKRSREGFERAIELAKTSLKTIVVDMTMLDEKSRLWILDKIRGDMKKEIRV